MLNDKLPGGYFDIPLDALDAEPGSEHEARLEYLMALVADCAPEAERDRYAGTVQDVRRMVRYMRTEGIIGCSLGMHYADDDSSAASVITVALKDIEWAPPKLTAVRAVSLRESPENVGLLTLPGGRPGSISDTLVTTPAVTGMAAQELYQCNLYVPAPSGVQLAVLSLSTVAVNSHRYYRDLRKALRTLCPSRTPCLRSSAPLGATGPTGAAPSRTTLPPTLGDRMRLSKNAEGFDGPVAWDTPGTRAALCRWVARLVGKMLGWTALWLAWLYGVVIAVFSGVVAALAALPLVVIAYLVGAQMYGLFKLWRMHRILKVYPWRQQPDGVHADRRRSRWVRAVFVLPNPDQPEKTESPEEHGGMFRIWDRVVRKGFDDELWYAGDPRFACVVARPGPKTLSYVAQPTAYDQRTSPRRKGLSPEARDRARAIGARVAD